ncbi:hypothetical protein [Paraburkholderia kirstenboschensis]|uniref:hypothetical protein n=1 Tax=Paraburkholderia TaxID=1822464 RepID=UPI0013E40EB5|nr:hypothetical protein [Paraburkholderia kirstenboschensis]
MRAKIPGINKRLIATCIRGIAGSRAVNHVEGDGLRLSHPLTPTFYAVGCDDCKTTYENLEGSHFLLRMKLARARFPDGDNPHRAS